LGRAFQKRISEQLDVCALQSLEEGASEQYREEDIPQRIAPTENGWTNVREFGTEKEIEAVLRITAKNADPKEIKVRVVAASDSVDSKILVFQ